MLPALPEISHCGGRSSSAQRASWQEGSGSRREHDDANNSKPLSTRSRPGRANRRPTWCWRGWAHASVATRQCRCSTDRPRAATARCRRACVEAAFGRPTQHLRRSMLGAALASAANKQRSARAERLCGIKAFIDVAAVTLIVPRQRSPADSLGEWPRTIREWPPGNRKNDRAVALSLSR